MPESGQNEVGNRDSAVLLERPKTVGTSVGVEQNLLKAPELGSPEMGDKAICASVQNDTASKLNNDVESEALQIKRPETETPCKARNIHEAVDKTSVKEFPKDDIQLNVNERPKRTIRKPNFKFHLKILNFFIFN